MISFETRLENFLGSTAFVADKNLQRAMWVERSEKISSVISLGELYAQFFDDNDIDNFIADEIDKSPLTQEQKKPSGLCEMRLIISQKRQIKKDFR